MFKKTKFAVALVVALSAMAFAASSASALEATDAAGGSVNATSSSVTFEGSGISIICPLTMTESLLTGPINVAAGNQIGEVTAVSIGSCSGGEVENVLGLPWRLTINSTLPANAEPRNATGFLVNIVGASFNLSTFFNLVNCLYSGNAGALITLTPTRTGETRYTARTIRALESVNLPFIAGNNSCPANGHFKGTFTLGATQTVTLS